VEIVSFFHVDFLVAGIAPMGDLLILLAYVVDDAAAGGGGGGGAAAAERPELRVVTRTNDEVSSDALSLHGFERLRPADYRLAARRGAGAGGAGAGVGGGGVGVGAGGADTAVYIVSPRDLVVARPRDFDDHIAWLLERRRYAQARRRPAIPARAAGK
jgi:vacuolar protein sorting-associated protein 41